MQIICCLPCALMFVPELSTLANHTRAFERKRRFETRNINLAMDL